ncbi:MAG TPA: glycoside hydrolase domain-containing protein, partial [Gemmatimonadales bacterium]|nr:glycoside hydrolase domain-containing protein [Gemmatimonadales bacterium]
MKRWLLLLALLVPTALSAQDVPYRIGRWDPDSLGNHRAVLRVDSAVKAVRVTIPWRRRDQHPELTQIMVTNASGRRMTNVVPVEITRERGTLVFEPSSGAGEYYVYFQPYKGSVRSNYPRITYRAVDTTANARWIGLQRLTAADVAAGRWRSLRAARVEAIEAVDSMSNRWPMEVIATDSETTALLARVRPAPFVLFAEDRTRPIIMKNELPQVWTAPGVAGRAVSGEPMKDEFFAFQVGVWALQALDSVQLSFSDLTGPEGATIPAAAFASFNTGGTDWQGRPMWKRVAVREGDVQPLWAGVMIPATAAAGNWEGTATVTAAGGLTVSIPVKLTVKDSTIAEHGDNEPWRLSRLRWLNSTLALDSTVVPPYTPVVARGTTFDILGRSVVLGLGGLPGQIRSSFAPGMTTTSATPRSILRAPVRFDVTTPAGQALTWQSAPLAVLKTPPGIAVWETSMRSGGVTAAVRGSLEFDGTLEYHIALTAADTTPVGDVALVIPYRSDVAKYWMGLGRKGGLAPDSLDWSWDSTRNQDAAWVGDVNAGAQLTLFDDRYDRPLNTNFYQLKRLVMPRSWQNGGSGGCKARRTGTAATATYTLRCASGARTLVPGDTLWYDFRLLVTPFHTIDPQAQFSNRFFHAYKPIADIQAAGANVVNVHHATAINPYINYPFFRPAEMRAYADSAHEVGIRFKIYYTVRELTNRAPEFWALRSLGHEVFAAGPGGGHSWLQEHVGGDYITGWVVPELRDIALVTSGISRWHNHYVEGLDWLVRHEQIDGLYLDDVAFDRTTMQRMRRVLARGRPAPMIDLHSANQFNPNDGFASSANLYLEHFPYIDRLWFGEYFDYNSAPDYWLVEISGIPFGLMGEMLQDGGNPWRGMLFGMTARLPWAGDPRPLWQMWDQAGIADAQMHGWWDPASPVKTG